MLFCSTLASFLYGEPCSERNTAYLYPNELVLPEMHPTYCLDLSKAKKPSNIKKLTREIIGNIREVDTLYADRLNLNKAPKAVIHGLPNLTMIDLTFNRIKHVPSLLDNVAPQLKTLLLDHNKLLVPQKRPLFVSKTLKTLSIASNGIANIYPMTFSRLPNLKVLYLNRNELKVISSNVFQPLFGLLYLNLEENYIRNVPSKDTMPLLLRHYLTDGQRESENEPKVRQPIKWLLSVIVKK